MTELEQASEIYKKIAELKQEKNALLVKKDRLNIIGETLKAKQVETEISKINAQIHEISNRTEYVRFKVFIEVIKTYLTRDQYKSAWERVGQILEHPELMQ